MKWFTRFKIAGMIFGIGFVFIQSATLAQNPTYACDIRSPAFVSDHIYEFDLYITRTGSTSLELANYQASIQVNPLLINGGTITPSIVSGSSGLLSAQQPTSISFLAASNCIRLAPKAPPRTLYTSTSSTNGTIVSEGSGTRVCRIRLTNTSSFGSFPLSAVWSFTINPYNTVVSAFVGPADHKVNTIITNPSDHGRALAVNVLLEGPYNPSTDQMSTGIHGLVPLVQPFNMAPWNYSGTETVASIPADVVDWVLIDLRDATDPSLATSATSKTVRAFFLHKDGTIVDLDGVSVPQLNIAAPTSNLYAVVMHRNHVSVMSNNALAFSSGTYNYNFSSAVSQAYGGVSGFKQIDDAPVRFGMVAGNVDADIEIGANDFTLWSQNIGLGSYLSADADMDADVGANDFTVWSRNIALGNTIPSKSHSAAMYKSQVPK